MECNQETRHKAKVEQSLKASKINSSSNVRSNRKNIVQHARQRTSQLTSNDGRKQNQNKKHKNRQHNHLTITCLQRNRIRRPVRRWRFERLHWKSL